MTRNRLFAAVAIIAAVVLTACSDMTAPKNDTTCPVTNGSQTCLGH
jgi:outer membrane biogenesis lipoprotein LolB